MDIAHLTTVFDADTQPTDRAFRRLDDRIRRFGARHKDAPKVTFKADTGPVDRAIRSVTARLARLSRQDAEVTIRANINPLMGALRTARAALWRFQDEKVRLEADTSRFRAQVEGALQEARAAAAPGVDVYINTRGEKRAIAKISAVGAEATRLGAQSPTVHVSERGAAKTALELRGLSALVDRLDRRRVTIDIDASAAEAVPALFNSIYTALERVETVSELFEQLTLPAMVSGLGGLAGALNAAAAGATGLAGALGGGLAGAIAQVGAALGLGTAALAGFGGALLNTIDLARSHTTAIQQERTEINQAEKAVKQAKSALKDATPGTLEYQQATVSLALAQQQLANETATMAAIQRTASPELIKLNKTLGYAKVAALDFAGALAERVAPGLDDFLGSAIDMADYFAGPFVETMGRMSDYLGGRFERLFFSGRQLENLETIFAGIRRAAVPALRAVMNMTAAAVNVLATFVPAGVSMVRTIDRMSAAVLRFTQSARGQRVIGRVWDALRQQASQLGEVVWNLTKGFFGLFAAMFNSGVANQMMGWLVRATAQFAKLGDENSRARRALNAYLRDARPVIAAMQGLINGLVKDWLKLSIASIHARDSATGMRSIVVVLRNLRRSAAAATSALIHEFERLGPEFSRLILNVALFAKAASRGVHAIDVMLRGLNALLEAFNSLPMPMKVTIVQITSFAVAGAGAVKLVSKLGRKLFDTGVLFLSLGTKSRKAAKDVTNFARRFPRLIAFLSGAWRGLKIMMPPLRLLPVLFLGLTNPITLVVAAVAGLAIAAVELVSHWKPAQRFFGRTVTQFMRRADQALRSFGRAVVNWIIRKGQQAVAWWRRNWPQIRAVTVLVFRQIQAIVTPIVRSVFGFVVRQGRWVVRWFRRNLPLIRKTTRRVFDAIHNIMTGKTASAAAVIRHVIGALRGFWKRNHKLIENIVRNTWKIIEALVGNAIRAVFRVVTLVMQLLTGDWRGAWRTIRKILRDSWRTMRQVTRSFANIIWDIVRVVWNEISHITSRIWNSIWRFLRRIWNNILQTVRNHLRNLYRSLVGYWRSISHVTGRWWNNIWDTVRDKTRNLKNSALYMVRALKRGLGRLWSDIGRAARNMWDKMPGWLTNPLGRGINSARRILGFLAGGLKWVLNKIGNPGGLAGGLARAEHALKTPIKFAKGGVMQPAVGGFADGKVPHAVYGEVGKKEYFIVPERKDNVRYLAGAANDMGYDIIPKSWQFASGGFLDAARAAGARFYALGGFGNQYMNAAARALNREVEARFPVDGSSYAGHPPGAVDWLVSSGVARGQQKRLGDAIASWLNSNYGALNLRAIIWYGRARFDGGPWHDYSPAAEGGGLGSADYASQYHMNHVHAQSLSAAFGKLNNKTSGYSGGGIGDWISKAKELYSKLKQVLAKGNLANLRGLGDLGAGLRSFGPTLIKDALSWAKDKIWDWAKSTFGFGGPSGSGTIPTKDHLRLLKAGFALSNAFPATPANLRAMDARIRQESGWNAEAVNNWDSNARMGHPSKGLAQVTDWAWIDNRARYGQDVGPFDSNWYKPVKNIAVALRYMRTKYGHVVGATGSGYGLGGVIPGRPGEPVRVLAHAGERILSRRTNQAFEYLAKSVTRLYTHDHRRPAPAAHRRPGTRPAGVRDVHLYVNVHGVGVEDAQELAERLRPVIRDEIGGALGRQGRRSGKYRISLGRGL